MTVRGNVSRGELERAFAGSEASRHALEVDVARLREETRVCDMR